MSKGNGKSVARGVPGAHGEGAGQAGQVSKGSKPVSAHVRGSGDFVFDMRALGKGPGEFKDEKRTAAAPDGVGSGLVLVPAGGDVALDLRFEAVSEGVLVTGSAVAPLTGECARCLDPLTTRSRSASRSFTGTCRTRVRTKDDGEERFLDGDLLDLEPAFRMLWCSRCRCRRSAGTTAPGCASSAARSSPDVGPSTGTATR